MVSHFTSAEHKALTGARAGKPRTSRKRNPVPAPPLPLAPPADMADHLIPIWTRTVKNSPILLTEADSDMLHVYCQLYYNQVNSTITAADRAHLLKLAEGFALTPRSRVALGLSNQEKEQPTPFDWFHKHY
jgi:phage terminase small subunit